MVTTSGALGPIAAIGNFDGVHRGHQLLLSETVRLAQAADAAAGVVVFNPHPRRYFAPDAPAFLLASDADRDRLIRAAGVEKIMPLAFDEALAALSPEDFVTKILHERLGLGGVVTGAEFRFGKDRAGDVDQLAALCAEHGLSAHVVEPIAHDGEAEKIGSSAVRAALREGDVSRAAYLLGRPWSVSGLVSEGRKLGATIGFATANLSLGPLLEPKFGVYAVKVDVAGVRRDGVANFGRRPTVGSSAPLLEAHIFDFDGALYGQEITVNFIDFIRPEMKFDGLDALKAQIAADCDAARKILAAQ